MKIREIEVSEIYKLLECITQLSEYHNKISINFKGSFPSKPYNESLNMFKESLQNGQSHIAVVEDTEKVVGFCKVDIVGKNGKLDYLVVLQEYRKKGYGKQLMEWAMDTFRKHSINHIEVKVIDGNDTIHLYEKYGFKRSAHILWYCEEVE